MLQILFGSDIDGAAMLVSGSVADFAPGEGRLNL